MATQLVFLVILTMAAAAPLRQSRAVKAAAGFKKTSSTTGDVRTFVPFSRFSSAPSPVVMAVPGPALGLPQFIPGPQPVFVPQMAAPTGFPTSFSNAIPVSPIIGNRFSGNFGGAVGLGGAAGMNGAVGGALAPVGAAGFGGGIDASPIFGSSFGPSSLLPGPAGGFSFGSAKPVAEMEFFIGKI